MLSVSRVVTQAASILADAGGTHWPQAQLVMFANDGVSMLAAALPHEFAEPLTITLTPGAEQQIPAGYSDIAEIIGTVDSSGNVQTYDWMEEESRAPARLLGAYTCAGGGGVSILPRFKIVGSGRGVFTVTPAPTAATDVRVMAIAEPPLIDVTNFTTVLVPLGTEFEPILTDYVVMRAYEVDAESDVANDRAAYHRNKVYVAINAQYAAASRMRTRWVLGMEGDDEADKPIAMRNEGGVIRGM